LTVPILYALGILSILPLCLINPWRKAYAPPARPDLRVLFDPSLGPFLRNPNSPRGWFWSAICFFAARNCLLLFPRHAGDQSASPFSNSKNRPPPESPTRFLCVSEFRYILLSFPLLFFLRCYLLVLSVQNTIQKCDLPRDQPNCCPFPLSSVFLFYILR